MDINSMSAFEYVALVGIENVPDADIEEMVYDLVHEAGSRAVSSLATGIPSTFSGWDYGDESWVRWEAGFEDSEELPELSDEEIEEQFAELAAAAEDAALDYPFAPLGYVEDAEFRSVDLLADRVASFL